MDIKRSSNNGIQNEMIWLQKANINALTVNCKTWPYHAKKQYYSKLLGFNFSFTEKLLVFLQSQTYQTFFLAEITQKLLKSHIIMDA